MTTPQQSAMRKALESEGCERLRDFYNVGPAQRAALESFVAALAQQVEQQPVAYAAFADNGNIRIWTSAPKDVQRLSEQVGFDLVPLYTAAPAPQPAQEHEMQDVRCQCCGYMTYHREHMGCIRAALQSAQPVAPLTDAQIKGMWTQYCGYPGGIFDFARAIESAK